MNDTLETHVGFCGVCNGCVMQSNVVLTTIPPQTPKPRCETCGCVALKSRTVWVMEERDMSRTDLEHFKHLARMAMLKRMTPKEAFDASVRAGIHNPDGTLRPPYDGSEEEDA